MGTADEIVNLDDDSAKVDLELGRIRERRENPGKSFLVNSIIPRTFDDYTLVVGLISGLVFFGSIFVASSGLIWGNSIAVDETLSGTFLDPSDCDDKRDEIWFETWVNQDQDLRIRSHNADSSSTALFITLWNQTEGYALSLESESAIGGIGDLSETVENHGLEEGDYLLLIQFRLWTDSSMDLSNQSFEELSSRVQDDPPDFESSKNFDITVETVKSASLLGSGESHKKMETFDDEPRACFTVQRMGGWGWALMFAEWVGGRETAMLTGGSAQVPPWYMAMVSLGMSIFFLCVQYPLMHRLYHRDVDDLLSSKQMSRLIETTIESASEKLHIEPE